LEGIVELNDIPILESFMNSLLIAIGFIATLGLSIRVRSSFPEHFQYLSDIFDTCRRESSLFFMVKI
jgi:hypothetical protein